MSGSLSGFLTQGAPVPAQPTGSDTSTSFPLWLQQFVYNTANAASNLASQPYSQYPNQQVATPSTATQQAWGMATNNVGNYAPALNNAVNYTATGAAPISTPAPITSPTITTPTLNSNDINQYLNPYQNQVVGALQQASNTNFFNNVLPNVQDRFVSAGQSRSPQEMQATNNAIYQNQQALDQAVAGSLASGYNTATQTAQQQQQQQLGLAQQQQGFQTGLAQQQQGVNLSTQQANRAAAQTAGAQFGQLGALTQQLGATDTGQIAAAGSAQDQVNQANINAALNNFYSQQQWPYQNLAYASNIIRGLQVPSNQQTVGTTYNVPYSASPLSTFIGTTLGASALGLKDGGHVRGALNRRMVG